MTKKQSEENEARNHWYCVCTCVYMFVILACEIWRQKDQKSMFIFNYILSLGQPGLCEIIIKK